MSIKNNFKKDVITIIYEAIRDIKWDMSTSLTMTTLWDYYLPLDLHAGK